MRRLCEQHFLEEHMEEYTEYLNNDDDGCDDNVDDEDEEDYFGLSM